MAKSPDLYTLCDVCDGMGIAADNALNETAPNGKKSCRICQGTRYLPLGLNKAQVDAALRKAAEYDKFMADFANDGSSERPTIANIPLQYVAKAEHDYALAKIAELNERLTAYRQGVLLTTDAPPEVTVHWQDDDFFEGIEDDSDMEGDSQ